MKHSPLTHRVPVFAWLAVALFALLIGACGFQPRGQAQPLGAIPGPLFISGINPYSDLHREFERQLNAAHVPLADSAADSAAVLRIENRVSDIRVLSVNSRNKAVEFELEEAARFSLRARDGGELISEQTARVVRIQFRPDDAVLGSEREAELLRADMRRDLVSQILHRAAARR